MKIVTSLFDWPLIFSVCIFAKFSAIDSVTRSQFDVTDSSEQIKEAVGTTEVDQENVKIGDDVINDDNESVDSIDDPDIDTADDDYNVFFGGVMGVYCRSSIHGDYSGMC